MLIFQIGFKFVLNTKATLRIICNLYSFFIILCLNSSWLFFCLLSENNERNDPSSITSCFLTIFHSERTREATTLACGSRTQACFANFDPHGEFRRSVGKMAQG